jgi:hypothetical protein
VRTIGSWVMRSQLPKTRFSLVLYSGSGKRRNRWNSNQKVPAGEGVVN